MDEIRAPKNLEGEIRKNMPVTPRGDQPHYRLNLKLSPDLKGYLHEEAYLHRMSITELVNRVLLQYSKEHPLR